MTYKRCLNTTVLTIVKVLIVLVINKLVESVGCVIFGILLIKTLTLMDVCATDVTI